MKDSNNENRARVLDVPPSVENDDSRDWSIEERDQLLLREREARLQAEVMRDANLALTQDLSLERILETLLDYLQKLVPFDTANVMLVEGDSYFVTSAIKGYEDFVEDMSLAKANIFSPKTNALFSQICETKQSLLVSDTKDEPRWQSVPGSEHTRNWIGVPLLVHDEIIGLYSLDKAQPGYFTAEHVKIAESLAMPAASAIQNAKLFRQVERHFSELEQRIAERKKAEDELRKQKEILQSIFDHIPIMISFYGDDGRIKLINREWESVRGWSLEEIREQKLDMLAEAYPGSRDLQRAREFIAEGSGEWADFKMRVKGGRVLDTAWAVVHLSDGMRINIGQDITERKQAEEALRHADQKFRNIFENAGEGIFQTTPEGQYIAANPVLARMHGFESPEELIGTLKDISREVYVDPARREEFKRLLEEHGVVRGFEHQIVRQDGSKIWVSVNARAVYDAQGAIRYYEGTAQDINERKRAEARSAAFATLARKLSGARTQLEAGRIIAQTASDLFAWDSCNLDLYDADRDLIHPMLNVDMIDGKQTNVTALHSDREPTPRSKRVIAHGPELLLREEPIQFDEDAIPFGDKSRPSASLMTVPIRHAARVIGLLSIQSDTAHRYDSAALADLQALADHCGEALNRIQAEESLSASEERYRDLVENSREFICTHDLDGLILSANRAAVEVLGYDPKDYCGKRNFREVLVPEVRDQFDDYLARIRRDGVASGLMLVQTATGDRRIWEYHNTLRTEGVAAPIVRGMARDITERKRGEEALQLFRNLIDQSSDAIEVIDPITFRFIDCNESAYRSLGYSREEFLSLTVFDIDPTADRSMMARLDEKMKESGFATLESLHRRKDGTTFPVEVNVKLVRFESDYRLAVVRDMTRRKHAEEALRESEERYRELFENARDAIYVHDLSGRYTSVNRAAEQLSGFSREQILGKHFSNFVSPRDLKQVRTNLCRKLDLENETIYEVNVVNRGGRRIPVEVSSRLIYENGVAVGVQGTARDITERKRAQEALRIYSQRLIQAQEAEREKIARELHDEIGQVLTAVRINLQSIQRSGGTNENVPRLDESIGIVDEALGRVRELSIELRPSLLDDLGLSAALRWYVDRYAQRTGIIAEVLNGFENDRLPRELETACFRIAQEALTNVARHAQAASVSVQLERSRERILLTVADDGVGFDIDHLRKSAPAASALGLRGMEERALAVGGHIEIDSGSGRGTHVRATFPLKRI